MRHRPLSQLACVVIIAFCAIPVPAHASVEIQRISSFLTGTTRSAVDKDRNFYFAGSTTSLNLPVTSNAFQKTTVASICGRIPGSNLPYGGRGPDIVTYCQHAYVIKIDPTGTTVLYATYLGGSFSEFATSIRVDDDGNAYVSGTTGSQDFPVTPGAYMTVPLSGSSGPGFLTKLSPDGSSLIYSTLLPGSPGRTWLSKNREIYITGQAAGASFPTTTGAIQSRRFISSTDLFVLKLDAAGSSLMFSTLLGGSAGELLTALTLDSEDNIYVGGYTASTPSIAVRSGLIDFSAFPTTPGAFVHMGGAVDLFIAKLNSTATELIFSSVLGGAGDDTGLNTLTLDNSGNIYFSGSTRYSPDFPLTENAIQKNYGGGLVGKLSADGSHLLYSTYIGTARSDSACCIRLDEQGNMVIEGSVTKPSFITTPDAAQPCYPLRPQGTSAAVGFYSVISADGSTLNYSTYADAQERVLARDELGNPYALRDGQIVRIDEAMPPQPATEPGVRCIIHGASLRQGPIAPGEVIQIVGYGVGPDEATVGAPNESGFMPKELGGVRVSIAGIPAPMLFASSARLTVVAPFGIAGKSQVQVEVHTEAGGLAPFTVDVTPLAHALFAQIGPDYNMAEAINEDGTINSFENPAKPGSIVRLFSTGLGVMEPSPPDGLVATDPNFRPVAQVSLGYGDEVVSVRNAPGRVAGVVEIAVRIHPNSSPGVRSYGVGAESRFTGNTASIVIGAR